MLNYLLVRKRYLVCYFGGLLLASCGSRQMPAPVVNVQAHIPLSERTKQSLTASQYVVKPGETLYSIAWRANIDVRTLSKINNLSAPYQIFPGQQLFLSENSAQTNSHLASHQNQNKSSAQTSENIHKKAVDLDKKQAYGETVGGGKLSNKNLTQAKTFSNKIRQWRWPAKGKIIEQFSTAIQGNKGINITGSRGDSIYAAASGKVVYAGDALRGYGNLIIIKHNDDYLSAYAHSDKILVKEQQAVNVGDVIATMGSSDAERVMLHFEVRFRGKPVNPLKYLPKR